MRRRLLPNANWRWPATMALLLAASVQAQTPPAATTKDTRAPSTSATRPANKPTQRIELPAAEKQALEAAANAPPAKAASATDELVPSEADAKALPPPEETTRIEQIRTRSGVSEIRITPALTGRTYTMTNREGQQPISATESLSGLSVPKFFTIEFGKPSERPAPPLPPPPSSQSR